MEAKTKQTLGERIDAEYQRQQQEELQAEVHLIETRQSLRSTVADVVSECSEAFAEVRARKCVVYGPEFTDLKDGISARLQATWEDGFHRYNRESSLFLTGQLDSSDEIQVLLKVTGHGSTRWASTVGQAILSLDQLAQRGAGLLEEWLFCFATDKPSEIRRAVGRQSIR